MRHRENQIETSREQQNFDARNMNTFHNFRGYIILAFYFIPKRNFCYRSAIDFYHELGDIRRELRLNLAL